MKFRTELNIPASSFPINHQDKIMSIGSCFSENIGAKLAYYKYNIKINPFGILFNPISIEKALSFILQDEAPNEQHFVQNELWHSLDFHSQIAALSPNHLLDKLYQIKENTKEHIKSSSFIFITLGTAFVYKYKNTNQYVANCQKISSEHFQKELLPINEIISSLKNIISLIQKETKVKKIIFSISPVRHIKDGIIENNLSKAHLISALHAVTNDAVLYFPAYEFLMDDLRDYRFYENDLLHPNSQAIEYIWNKFSASYFTAETIDLNKKIDTIQLALQHKPFHPEGKDFISFKDNLNSKIKALTEKHPYIQF